MTASSDFIHLSTRMHQDAFETPLSRPRITRRRFIQTAFGGAVALGLVGCDQVEDGLETYTGPEIDELEFVSFNAQYYTTTIDGVTQFPHHSLVQGALSGVTDPVAIAYRLQYLIDINDTASIETILDGLLEAQDNSISFIDYRGFLPTLQFASNLSGFQRSSPEFLIADNAVLSARVAMAADAFAGTAIESKALTFLANQKEGYNFYLSGTGSLLFPIGGSALENTVAGPQIDLFFSGYYAELAFVLSYFIGDSSTIADPQVGLDAWQALTSGNAVPTGQHSDSFAGLVTISAPLAQNGSGYQYFRPLLALPTASIGPALSDALYNALYSFLDAARFENLPGIYSAGPNTQGFFLTDNGLGRLTASGARSTSQETVVTVDALAAAMRLFPETPGDMTSPQAIARQTLRRWIGVYDAVPGVRSPDGLYGSVDKAGNVAQALFARQNAAMILMNSTAPDHLENFLAANGKTSLADMMAMLAFDVNGAPLARLDEPLPLPQPRRTPETAV